MCARSLGLMLLLSTAVGSVFGQAGRPAPRRTRMDVKITLSLGRSELIVGESTSVKISIANTSSAPVSVPDPSNDANTLKLRVRSLAGGRVVTLGSTELQEQTPHEFVPGFDPAMVQLAPGQQVHRDGDLLPW